MIGINGGIDLGNSNKRFVPGGGDEEFLNSSGGINLPPAPPSSTGPGGSTPPYGYPPGVDPSTLPPGNGDINNSAMNMIGVSTAGIPGTSGGSLGCAAAVCMMFQNATGQQLVPGRDMVLGTGTLWSSMNNDPRFVRVDFADARAGDIVVTARNESTGRAGHTGIVTNNGRIISNSSSGFQGSSPGTIQNNYSISQWSSVTSRNPSQTGVFRFVGG
jgi:hypothetical protein